jgi:hypothetical protein
MFQNQHKFKLSHLSYGTLLLTRLSEIRLPNKEFKECRQGKRQILAKKML